MQRSPDPSTYGMSKTSLFRLWLLAAVVNSGYSYYWDVARDWDLSLFSSKKGRENPEYPWGLRRHRYFHAKEFYYVAIVVDGLLRCTWAFKLSPRLDRFNDWEGGIFTMQLLEVLRRWIWIFFRVECEWGEFCFLLPQPLFRLFRVPPVFVVSEKWRTARLLQKGTLVDWSPNSEESSRPRT